MSWMGNFALFERTLRLQLIKQETLIVASLLGAWIMTAIVVVEG